MFPKDMDKLLANLLFLDSEPKPLEVIPKPEVYRFSDDISSWGLCVLAGALILLGLKLFQKLVSSRSQKKSRKESQTTKAVDGIHKPIGIDVDNKAPAVVANALKELGNKGKNLLKKPKRFKNPINNHENCCNLVPKTPKVDHSKWQKEVETTFKEELGRDEVKEDEGKDNKVCEPKTAISSSFRDSPKAVVASKNQCDVKASCIQLDSSESQGYQTEQMKKSCFGSRSQSNTAEPPNLKRLKKKSMSVSFHPSLPEVQEKKVVKPTSRHTLRSSCARLNFLMDAPNEMVHDHALKILGAGESLSRQKGSHSKGRDDKAFKKDESILQPLRIPSENDKEQLSARLSETLSPRREECQNEGMKSVSLRSIFSRSKGTRQKAVDTSSNTSTYETSSAASRSDDPDANVHESSGYFCLLTNEIYPKFDEPADKIYQEKSDSCLPLPPSDKFPDMYTTSSDRGVTAKEKVQSLPWQNDSKKCMSFYTTPVESLKPDLELKSKFTFQNGPVPSKSKNKTKKCKNNYMCQNKIIEIHATKDTSSHKCGMIHEQYHDLERYDIQKYGICSGKEKHVKTVRNEGKKPSNNLENEILHLIPHIKVSSKKNELRGISRSRIPVKTKSRGKISSQGKQWPRKGKNDIKSNTVCSSRATKEVSYKSQNKKNKKSRLTISDASLVSGRQESIRMVESLLCLNDSLSYRCSGDSFTLDMEKLPAMTTLPAPFRQSLETCNGPKKVFSKVSTDRLPHALSIYPYLSSNSREILYSKVVPSSYSSCKLENDILNPKQNIDKGSLALLESASDSSETESLFPTATDVGGISRIPFVGIGRPSRSRLSPIETNKEHVTSKSISVKRKSTDKSRKPNLRQSPSISSISPIPFQKMILESKNPILNTLILCNSGIKAEHEQLSSMVPQSTGRVRSFKKRNRSNTFPTLQSFLDQIEKENERRKHCSDHANAVKARKVSDKHKKECPPGFHSVARHFIEKSHQERESRGTQRSFESKSKREIHKMDDVDTSSTVSVSSLHLKSRGTVTRNIQGSRLIPHFGVGPRHYVSSSSISSAEREKDVGNRTVKQAQSKRRPKPFGENLTSALKTGECRITGKSPTSYHATQKKLLKTRNVKKNVKDVRQVAKFDVRNWKKGVLQNMKRDLDKKVGRRPKPVSSEAELNGGVAHRGKSGSDVSERKAEVGEDVVDECSQVNFVAQTRKAEVKSLEMSEEDFVCTLPQVSHDSSRAEEILPSAENASNIVQNLRRVMEIASSKVSSESLIIAQNRCLPVAETLIKSLYVALNSENECKDKVMKSTGQSDIGQTEAKGNTCTYNDLLTTQACTNQMTKENVPQHEESSDFASRQNDEGFITSTLNPSQSRCKINEQGPHPPKRQNRMRTNGDQSTAVKRNSLENVTEPAAKSSCDNDTVQINQHIPSPEMESHLEIDRKILKQPPTSPDKGKKTVCMEDHTSGQQTGVSSKADLHCMSSPKPNDHQGKAENKKYEVHKVRQSSNKLSDITVPPTLEKKGEAISTLKRGSHKLDCEKEAMPSYTSKYKATESSALKFSWKETLAFRKRFQYLMEHNKNLEARKTSQSKAFHTKGRKQVTNVLKNKLDKKVDTYFNDRNKKTTSQSVKHEKLTLLKSKAASDKKLIHMEEISSNAPENLTDKKTCQRRATVRNNLFSGELTRSICKKGLKTKTANTKSTRTSQQNLEIQQTSSHCINIQPDSPIFHTREVGYPSVVSSEVPIGIKEIVKDIEQMVSTRRAERTILSIRGSDDFNETETEGKITNKAHDGIAAPGEINEKKLYGTSDDPHTKNLCSITKVDLQISPSHMSHQSRPQNLFWRKNEVDKIIYNGTDNVSPTISKSLSRNQPHARIAESNTFTPRMRTDLQPLLNFIKTRNYVRNVLERKNTEETLAVTDGSDRVTKSSAKEIETERSCATPGATRQEKQDFPSNKAIATVKTNNGIKNEERSENKGTTGNFTYGNVCMTDTAKNMNPEFQRAEVKHELVDNTKKEFQLCATMGPTFVINEENELRNASYSYASEPNEDLLKPTEADIIPTSKTDEANGEPMVEMPSDGNEQKIHIGNGQEIYNENTRLESKSITNINTASTKPLGPTNNTQISLKPISKNTTTKCDTLQEGNDKVLLIEKTNFNPHTCNKSNETQEAKNTLEAVNPVSPSQKENKQVLKSFYRSFPAKAVRKTRSCFLVTNKKMQSSFHPGGMKSKIRAGKRSNASAESESMRKQVKSPPPSNIRWKVFGRLEDICSLEKEKNTAETESKKDDERVEAMQKKEDSIAKETMAVHASQVEKDSQVKRTTVHVSHQQMETNRKIKLTEENVVSQGEKDEGIQHTTINPKNLTEKDDKVKWTMPVLINQIEKDNRIKQVMATQMLQTVTVDKLKQSTGRHEEEGSVQQVAMNLVNQTDKNVQETAMRKCDTKEEKKIKQTKDNTTTPKRHNQADTDTSNMKATKTNYRINSIARNQLGLKSVQGEDRITLLDTNAKSVYTIKKGSSQLSLATTLNEATMAMETRSDSPHQSKRDSEASCYDSSTQTSYKLCTSGYNTGDVSSTSGSQLPSLLLEWMRQKQHSTSSFSDAVHAKTISRNKLKKIPEEESSHAVLPRRQHIARSHRPIDVNKLDLLKETFDSTGPAVKKKDMLPSFDLTREKKNDEGKSVPSSSRNEKTEKTPPLSGLRAPGGQAVVDTSVKRQETIFPQHQNQENQSITKDETITDSEQKEISEVNEGQAVTSIDRACVEKLSGNEPTGFFNAQNVVKQLKDGMTERIDERLEAKETDYTEDSLREGNSVLSLQRGNGPPTNESITECKFDSHENVSMKTKDSMMSNEKTELANSHAREEIPHSEKCDTLNAGENEQTRVIDKVHFASSGEGETLLSDVKNVNKEVEISAPKTQQQRCDKLEVTLSEITQGNDANSNRVGYTTSSHSSIETMKLSRIQAEMKDTNGKSTAKRTQYDRPAKKRHEHVAAITQRFGHHRGTPVKFKEETLDKTERLLSSQDSNLRHSLMPKPSQNFHDKRSKYLGVRRKVDVIENMPQVATACVNNIPKQIEPTVGSHVNLQDNQKETFTSLFDNKPVLKTPIRSQETTAFHVNGKETSMHIRKEDETTLILNGSPKDLESKTSKQHPNTSPLKTCSPPKVRKRTLKYIIKSEICQCQRQAVNESPYHDPLNGSLKRDDTFITSKSKHLGNDGHSQVKTLSGVQISVDDQVAKTESKLSSILESGKNTKQTSPSFGDVTSRTEMTSEADIDNKISSHIDTQNSSESNNPISWKTQELKKRKNNRFETVAIDKSDIQKSHKTVSEPRSRGKDSSPQNDGCATFKDAKPHSHDFGRRRGRQCENKKIPISDNQNQKGVEGQVSLLRGLEKVTECKVVGKNSSHIALGGTTSTILNVNTISKHCAALPKDETPSSRLDDLESILNTELNNTGNPNKPRLVSERFFGGLQSNKKRTRRVRHIKQVSSLGSNKDDLQYLRETQRLTESSTSITSLRSAGSASPRKLRTSYRKRVPVSSKQIRKLDEFLQNIEEPSHGDVPRSTKSRSKEFSPSVVTCAHEDHGNKPPEVTKIHDMSVSSEKIELRPQSSLTITQASKTENDPTSTFPRVPTESIQPTISSPTDRTLLGSIKSQMTDTAPVVETEIKNVRVDQSVNGSGLCSDDLVQTRFFHSSTAVKKDGRINETVVNPTIADEKDVRDEYTNQMCNKTNATEKRIADKEIDMQSNKNDTLYLFDTTNDVLHTCKESVKSATPGNDIAQPSKVNANLNITEDETSHTKITAELFWIPEQDTMSEKNVSTSSSSIVLSWIGSDAMENEELLPNTVPNFLIENCKDENLDKNINEDRAGFQSPCSSQVVTSPLRQNYLNKADSIDSGQSISMRKLSGLSKVWEGTKSKLRSLVTSPKKKRKRIDLGQFDVGDVETETAHKSIIATTSQAPGEFRKTYIGDDITSFLHSDKNYNKAQDVKSIKSPLLDIPDDSRLQHHLKRNQVFQDSNTVYQTDSYNSYSLENTNKEDRGNEDWNYFFSDDKPMSSSASPTHTERLAFGGFSYYDDSERNEMCEDMNLSEYSLDSPVDNVQRNDYVDSAFAYASTKSQSPMKSAIGHRQVDDGFPPLQQTEKKSPYFSFGCEHKKNKLPFQRPLAKSVRDLEISDWPLLRETLSGLQAGNESQLRFETPRTTSIPKPRPRQSTGGGRKNREKSPFKNETVGYDRNNFYEKRVRFAQRSGLPSSLSPCSRWKANDTRTQRPARRMSLEQHLKAMTVTTQDSRNCPPSNLRRSHEGSHNLNNQTNKDAMTTAGPGAKKTRTKVSLDQHLNTRSERDGHQTDRSSTEQQGSNNDASKSTSSQASINWYKPQSLPSPVSVTIVRATTPQRESSIDAFHQAPSQTLPPSQWRRNRMPVQQRLENQIAASHNLVSPPTAETSPPQTSQETGNPRPLRPRQLREAAGARSTESCTKTVSKIVQMFEKIRDA